MGSLSCYSWTEDQEWENEASGGHTEPETPTANQNFQCPETSLSQHNAFPYICSSQEEGHKTLKLRIPLGERWE